MDWLQFVGGMLCGYAMLSSIAALQGAVFARMRDHRWDGWCLGVFVVHAVLATWFVYVLARL